VHYVDHLDRVGCTLFQAACAGDLEGIVGKWQHGSYETDGVSTTWVKIKNPTYSQMVGRRKLFERRRDSRGSSRRERRRSPELLLTRLVTTPATMPSRD
jgi:ATP-dependent DNA ligase